MAEVDQKVIDKIDALQNHYMMSLDRKDMQGWYSTFADKADVSYVCVSAENDSLNLPISLMLDDCQARLQDRITFVTEIWKGTFQDYRTRHFAHRMLCTQDADGNYRVISNFSINYTFDPNPTAILTSGVYEDVITEENGELKFLSKRAVYDTTVLPQYIVYPF